jgi:hypothetical protein
MSEKKVRRNDAERERQRALYHYQTLQAFALTMG